MGYLNDLASVCWAMRWHLIVLACVVVAVVRFVTALERGRPIRPLVREYVYMLVMSGTCVAVLLAMVPFGLNDWPWPAQGVVGLVVGGGSVLAGARVADRLVPIRCTHGS